MTEEEERKHAEFDRKADKVVGWLFPEGCVAGCLSGCLPCALLLFLPVLLLVY